MVRLNVFVTFWKEEVWMEPLTRNWLENFLLSAPKMARWVCTCKMQEYRLCFSSIFTDPLNSCNMFWLVLQPDVLETVIPYLEADPPSCLPSNESGDTAAHFAAQEGHLHCLQVLNALHAFTSIIISKFIAYLYRSFDCRFFLIMDLMSGH